MNLQEIFADATLGGNLASSNTHGSLMPLFAGLPDHANLEYFDRARMPKIAALRASSWLNKIFYRAYASTTDCAERFYGLRQLAAGNIGILLVFRGDHGNSGLLFLHEADSERPEPAQSRRAVRIERNIGFGRIRDEMIGLISTNALSVAHDLAMEIGAPGDAKLFVELVRGIAAGIVDDVRLIAEPIVAAAPNPNMQGTSGVPSCAAMIEARGVAQRMESTAGVACYSRPMRQPVLTAAWHGVSDPGAAITVYGHPTTIVDHSPVMDLALLQRNAQIDQALSPFVQVRSVMTRSPYFGEAMHFRGYVNSGSASILPVALDIAMPGPSRGLQLRIYTQRVTDQGDSGSALVNTSSNDLAGFAFKNSPTTAAVQCSSWIWANSAFHELGLTL